MKILIIDGEIEVASLLAESVKGQGHEAIVAYDGREGLALLTQHQLDAVFLDVFLPEVSGIEVLRQIRRTDWSLPVIIVTGRASPEELEEARRLGVTEIIQKPFILTQFDDALARLRRG
ncbi:MAG: response regulator [Acidobacteriota bacterium]